MTESSKDQETLSIKAKVRGQKQVKPWDAFFWKALGEIISFFPSYRNSREGRKKAKQMRVLIVGGGLLLLVLAGTAETRGGLWIILGLLIACMAFVVPVEDLKKRTWRNKIKKRQKPSPQTVWGKGEVLFDGRRVELRADSEKVRRVRVDRGKHELKLLQQVASTGAKGDPPSRRSAAGPMPYPCIEIAGPGGKAANTIWVCADAGMGDSLEYDGEITDEEMDRPATAKGSDWTRLWEALKGLQ